MLKNKYLLNYSKKNQQLYLTLCLQPPMKTLSFCFLLIVRLFGGGRARTWQLVLAVPRRNLFAPCDITEALN